MSAAGGIRLWDTGDFDSKHTDKKLFSFFLLCETLPLLSLIYTAVVAVITSFVIMMFNF